LSKVDPQAASVVDGLAIVQHTDGRSGPWHPGLGPRALGLERHVLRDGCYVVVVGLSMKRDSE